MKIDYYYGDKAKLGIFLVQLKVVFTLEGTEYNTQKKRVLLAGMHLRGAAFN